MTSSKTNAFEFLMSKKRKIHDEDNCDSDKNTKKSKSDDLNSVIEIIDCEDNDLTAKKYNNFSPKKISNCYSIYPTISHIQQNKNDLSPIWNLPSIKLECLTDPIDYANLTIECKTSFDRIRFDFDDDSGTESKCNNSYFVKKLTADETRAEIMNLQNAFRKKFPIRKYYGRLVSKKLDQCSISNTNLWSNIFRPICIDDLLSNDRNTIGLDKWLRAWKNFNNDNPARMKIVNDRKNKKLKRKKQNERNIFIDDTDYEKEAKRLKRNLNNWKVIIGPCGSSKTATLKALCDQYNIDILEWNASSFRTGRNLLQKFQEATKSYNIHSSNHFTTKNSIEDCEKMSLILIKDFDLIFDDYDEGFLQALDTLIAKSKRPIILISSSTDIANFEKRSIFQFLDNDNTDHLFMFERNSSEHLRIFFQLLLLATEKIYLNDSFLNTLIALFRNDIRRIFMQLEFWFKNIETFQSNSLTILNKSQNGFDLEHFWWKFNEDFCKLNKNTENVRHEFQDLCYVFDTFSISDLISTNQTNNCFRENNKCQQNEMSLKPSTEMYSEHLEVTNEIIEFLTQTNRNQENFNYLQKIENTSMYKQKKISASKIFKNALPEFQYRHDLNDVILLDCLPYLRQIYRAEYEQYCYASSTNSNRKFNLHQRTYLRKFHIRYDDQHNQDLLQFHLKCFQQQQQQQDFLL